MRDKVHSCAVAEHGKLFSVPVHLPGCKPCMAALSCKKLLASKPNPALRADRAIVAGWPLLTCQLFARQTVPEKANAGSAGMQSVLACAFCKGLVCETHHELSAGQHIMAVNHYNSL